MSLQQEETIDFDYREEYLGVHIKQVFITAVLRKANSHPVDIYKLINNMVNNQQREIKNQKCLVLYLHDITYEPVFIYKDSKSFLISISSERFKLTSFLSSRFMAVKSFILSPIALRSTCAEAHTLSSQTFKMALFLKKSSG